MQDVEKFAKRVSELVSYQQNIFFSKLLLINFLFLKRAKKWPTSTTSRSHVFTINDENGNEIGNNRGYRGKFIFFKFIDKS